MTIAGLPKPSPEAATLRPDAVAAVQCHDLAKRFPVPRGFADLLRAPRRREWVQSLRGVSFEVPEGELFGILGPNGAGKTTLFQCITGLVTADAGLARIRGYDVRAEASAAKAQIGVVFATERAMNWRLDARANLRLFAVLYGLPADQVEERIEAALALVELADTNTRLAGTFSSGMKQRLSLARALLSDPPILLLDEPTRSLDPVSAKRFRAFLREDVARRGRTVLIATHSADEAFGLCDRVLVLDRGRVLAVESATRLAERYADRVYRAWTTSPQHPALGARGARLTSEVESGWSVVEFPPFASEEEAADTLRAIIEAGVPVSRYERAAISLGELLERMVAHSSATTGAQ